MKHPDDLTKMWRDMMERREKIRRVKDELAHELQMRSNKPDDKQERNDDGRLPTAC